MFNRQISEAFIAQRGLLGRGVLVGARPALAVLFCLAVFGIGVLASPPAVAAGRLTLSDIEKMVKADCRKISRKALFYVSARCAFKVLDVSFKTRRLPQLGDASGGADPTVAGDTQGLSAAELTRLKYAPLRDNVLIGFPSDYNPELETDSQRRDDYYAKRKELQRNRKKGNADPVYVAPEQRTMKVLVRSRSFVKDTDFSVEYRLHYQGSRLTSREIVRVRKQFGLSTGARPKAGSQSPATVQPEASTPPTPAQ